MSTPKKHYIHSCCMCTDGKNSDRFTDIFSKTGKDGELEKINYVIGIKVKEVRELPTNVCRKCRGQLITFSDFKAKALSVQNELALYTTSKTEVRTRGGTLGFPACIHIRNFKM